MNVVLPAIEALVLEWKRRSDMEKVDDEVDEDGEGDDDECTDLLSIVFSLHVARSI